MCKLFFFFFQAEDGIRDKLVTGVQTCALPISRGLDKWVHVLGHAELRIMHVPSFSLALRLGDAESLHTHKRKFADGLKGAVGVRVIYPLLCQGLLLANCHRRKCSFVHGSRECTSLVCVSVYGDNADASKIVGNPNKKTRCHLSCLGHVSKTSFWHPIKHKTDEIVHVRIELQMVFEPRLERARRGCFRLRDRSRWWPRILLVHAGRMTPGERSPEEEPGRGA